MPPWLKTLFAVFAAVSSAVLGFSRTPWPSKQFWNDRPAVLVVAITWLSLWSLYETIDRALAARKAKHGKRREAIARHAEQILKGVLVNVSQVTGLDWTKIGLHLFVVEKKWALLPRPHRYEYQRHAVRVKMSEYPPPTGITWTKGKGVIGRCWARRAFVGRDMRKAYRNFMAYEREQWEQLKPARRFGLTFEEFDRTRAHAGTILAAPVLSQMGSTYLGCVSLDAPGDCYATLNTHGIKERLQAAASYIAHTVAGASDD